MRSPGSTGVASADPFDQLSLTSNRRRMHNNIQLLDPPLPKGDARQRRTVKRSIGSNHRPAEVSSNSRIDTLPWLHQLPPNLVGR